jgi:hypothetical protein
MPADTGFVRLSLLVPHSEDAAQMRERLLAPCSSTGPRLCQDEVSSPAQWETDRGA